MINWLWHIWNWTRSNFSHGSSNCKRVNADTRKQLVQSQYYFEILEMHFQILYMKLFIVLGLLWSCESIHFIIHDDDINGCSSSSAEVFFRIIDCLNLLRGFFIFLIFVCKQNVWKKIQAYYRVKMGKSDIHSSAVNKVKLWE